MTTDNPFKQAGTKNVRDIVRGDIILFKDPVLGWDWQRGIVYDPLVNIDEKRVVGFMVLPVDTIAKKDERVPPFSFMEKQNASIVQQAGGNPAIHKTLVQFNLRTVANVGKMTGDDDKKEVRTLGSYAGSSYMVELLNQVETLYHQQRLYKDNKRVVAETVIRILPRGTAEQEAIENSKARRAAYETLARINQEFGGTSVGKRLQDTLRTFTVDDAMESGRISSRSYNFLKATTMEGTGKPPELLIEAYDLVKNQPERLRGVFGLASGGKIYKDLVQDVKQAIESLRPPENNGGPS